MPLSTSEKKRIRKMIQTSKKNERIQIRNARYLIKNGMYSMALERIGWALLQQARREALESILSYKDE
jgi:hypothetical protein